MKKLLLLLLLSSAAWSQGVRIDVPLLTSGPNVPSAGGPLPQTLFLANATVAVCVHPSPLLSSCVPVTTYTDATLHTPCPTNTPLVQLPGSACTGSTGAHANFGIWYAGGPVDYFVSSTHGTQGPFTANSSASTGGSINLSPQFSMFYQPNSGTAAVAQGDPHATTDGNGNVSVITSRPSLSPVADITNPAYGAAGNDTADDAPAVRAAVAAVEAAGSGTVFFPPGKTYRMKTTIPGHTNVIILSQASHVHFVCGQGATIDLQDMNAGNNSPAFLVVANPTPAMTFPWLRTGYPFAAIPNSGASTITFTNPSDASHFQVGDGFYMYGGPGTESGTDGEWNWVTSSDSGTGIVGLLKPTAKPYTGNQSPTTTIGVILAVPGVDHTTSPATLLYYQDISVEGCTVINSWSDFMYVAGPVIGLKILNNTVNVQPTAVRGMGMNPAEELQDVEIAGNSYVQSVNEPFTQLAWGNRDIYIHDNSFTSGNGRTILNPSQGVVGLNVVNNNFYYTMPASSAFTNQAAILNGTVYQAHFDSNTFNVNIQSSASNNNGINMGLSNGNCVKCTVNNNIILITSANTSLGAAINDVGSNTTIVGNHITMYGARTGISISSRSTVSYAMSTVIGNQIRMVGVSTFGKAIAVQGTDPRQAQVTVVGNNIIGDSAGANGIGIQFGLAGGGVVVGNNLYNLATAIDTSGGGAPTMAGNACTGVTTTTNCGTPLTNARLIGSITTDSSNFYTVVRTLPTVISDEVDIGSFSTLANSNTLVLEVQTSLGHSKHYVIGMSFSSTNNVWMKAVPIMNACTPGTQCATNDSDLEFNCFGRVYSFRLRRTLGSTAEFATVSMTQYGLNTDVFTPSTATSSVSAPASNYPWGMAAATSTSIGGVICDGSSITCAADGTITATAAGISRFQVSITPAAATVSSCVEQTFNTFTGIVTGKAIALSPPGPLNSHIWIGSVRASASNTIAINFCSDATGGTPPAGGWTATQ